MALGNNHVVQVSVQVNDRATDPMRKIANETDRMSSNFRKIGTSIGAFSTTMGRLSSVLDRAANSMYKFNLYTSNLQRNVRNIGYVTAGATAAVGVQSANKAIDFEFKMRQMQTRMEVGPNVRQQVEKYILNDLNQQTMFKPNQIADIGILLGQAGINNLPDMKSLLKTTTFFSEAVDADVNQAGEMIIAAAKGFDISMDKSTEITDKLTVALNKSLLRVEEMPHAIGELAGRAKMFGQSFDSSLVALMVGRDQGMSAAQTSQDFLHGLRQMSLIGRDDILFPRRKEYYEKLGVDTSFFDIEKKQLKEFPEIIASLEKSLVNTGMMPSKDAFYKAVKDNGGFIPDGLINKMESMPLISRVFGAAGQAPILMGLQARYEEVNKITGEKTGNISYGSDALKKMQAELKNSQGAVDKVHAEIADTAKFQLGILTGAWEAAQIKVTDDFLPVIKVASNELTNYLNGVNKPGGLDRFNTAIKASADNMRESNPLLADLVETMGDLAVTSIKVADTLGPTMKQIGGAATDNLINGSWSESLWKLPYDVVNNGLGFIKDVASGNEESDKAISQLPPELQDNAKLTRSLIQGGVILVAAGAIVKIIELAFRAAATVAKGAQLGKLLTDLIFGSGKGKGKGVLGGQSAVMNVQAGVVNVYGGTGGLGGGGSKDIPDSNLPPRNTRTNKPGNVKGLGWSIPTIVSSIAGYYISERFQQMSAETMESKNKAYQQMGITDPMVHSNIASGNFKPIPSSGPTKDDIMSRILNSKNPVNTTTNPLTDEQINGVVNYLSNIQKETSSAVTAGFGDVNNSLQNVKIQNQLTINPIIRISGNIKDKIPDMNVVFDSNQNGIFDALEKRSILENKRVDK